jgi:hypothetical protein
MSFSVSLLSSYYELWNKQIRLHRMVMQSDLTRHARLIDCMRSIISGRCLE